MTGHIFGRTATSGSQVRITFFRSDDNFDITYNSRVIAQVFNDFSENIPLRSRLAMSALPQPIPMKQLFTSMN
jgi:hypothetical protein